MKGWMRGKRMKGRILGRVWFVEVYGGREEKKRQRRGAGNRYRVE